MSYRVTLFFVLFCLLMWKSCAAQAITIKVISADTGKPLARKAVMVEKWVRPQDLPNPRQIVQVNPKLSLKTTKEGAATFQVSELGNPRAKQIWINVATGGNWIQCSPDVVRLEDIVQSGVVTKNSCDSAAARNREYVAKPGEIVIFTRHESFIENLKDWVRAWPG